MPQDCWLTRQVRLCLLFPPFSHRKSTHFLGVLGHVFVRSWECSSRPTRCSSSRTTEWNRHSCNIFSAVDRRRISDSLVQGTNTAVCDGFFSGIALSRRDRRSGGWGKSGTVV